MQVGQGHGPEFGRERLEDARVSKRAARLDRSS